MTVQEAMSVTGMCYHSVLRHCERGSFEAWKPRGNRGGWEIDPRGFNLWLLRRKMQFGNAPMRAMARRQLEAAQ